MRMSKVIERSPDRLLLAAANLIVGSVGSMQQAVNSVADISILREQPIPEMIVAFQAFDKLTQEFSALAEMLQRYAYISRSGQPSQIDDIIQAIPLSELKKKIIETILESEEVVDFLEIGRLAVQSEKVF